MQLTILSDPPSLIKEDLEAIEKRIFEQDIPTPLRKFKVTSLHDDSSSDTHVDGETVKLGDIYSPLASLDNTMISPRIESHRVKLEDLNVEEPLTPPILIPAPPKAVHFSNIIEEMLLDHPSSSRSDILEDSFFNDAFGDAAERAKRQLEQETLIEADSTARVEVPFVDFSLPNPPWKILQEHFTNSTILLAKQKSVIVDIVGTDNPEWPGVKQLDFQLRWTPFPHNLAEIAVEEDFQSNDATWEVFVEDPDDSEVIDSSSLTWKPPGLRILRDEDDHDEIELGKFKTDNPLDILFLVKKRKMELEEGGSFSQNVAREEAGDAAGSTSNVSLVVKQQLRKSTPKPGSFTSAPPKSQLDQTQDQGLSLLLGGPFSTHNSLQNYLELRGSKKPKLMDSFCFATNNGQAQTPTQPVESRLPQQDIVQLPTRKPPIAKADPLPSPDIRVPTEPVNIIVASTLLKHRALIKYLEAQIPSLTLLERDFAAHNTTVWLPGSVTRSPIASPLASEADIGVSSSTGIVITTLQRIKQKPLPGQKTKPSIRDRVEKVSLRYEKLVVLVSEERTDETTNGLDDNDCLAFSEFVGFTLGLEAAVTVQFVGGGEETLSKWLESAIIQNGPIGESILLEEETHWELFLRRAGMNTFAAQEIIIALKAPDGVDPSSPTKVGQFGLTAFVEMNREHRINRFCHLCGKKLLERVSAVVDSKWE
jgi:hypothetical protein